MSVFPSGDLPIIGCPDCESNVTTNADTAEIVQKFITSTTNQFNSHAIVHSRPCVLSCPHESKCADFEIMPYISGGKLVFAVQPHESTTVTWHDNVVSISQHAAAILTIGGLALTIPVMIKVLHQSN